MKANLFRFPKLQQPIVIRRTSTQESITTIEVRRWLPAVVLILCAGWYLISPTKIAAMALVALASIIGAGYLWSRSLAIGVSGSRRLRYAALQVGDQLEEEITLQNQSALPVLWAEFVDHSNIPGYSVSSVRAADSWNKIQWRARSICARRGVYLLGPWELLLGDPFGIFAVRILYHQKHEVLVYPPLAEFPQQLLPHAGLQGEYRPLHLPIRADTTNAFSTREYAPGDPLRQLHWPTTARRGSLFVKIFEPEALTSIWFVPDCDTSVHLGQGPGSSFESMITIIASLSAQLLAAGMSVGLFAGTDEGIILPQKGQPHLWDILRALAVLEPQPGAPLSRTLEQSRRLISARSMLVIITPSTQLDWLPHLQHLTNRQAARRAQALLLDPLSFGGTQSIESLVPLLHDYGIPSQVIGLNQIKEVTAAYGELSRWEFTEGATGKAILRRAPREAQAAAAEKAR